MPILRKTEDPHLVYAEAFRHLTIDGAPPMVVASRLKRFTSPLYPVRVLITVCAALLLVVDIYRAQPWRQAVLVREFWSLPLLVTSPLLWPVAGQVLFNVNHNLTGAGEGVPWPIRLLARLGFRFVLFDGATSVAQFPAALRSAFLVPLFPSVAQPEKRKKRKPPFRVGLVGSIASIEEQSPQFFEQLARVAGGETVVLCYGARDVLPKQLSRIDGVDIVDTQTRAGFRTYLASLDIAIFVANSESYYHRHSGTVMDAVSAGIVPVVPNFPVLNAQISTPVPVGVAYDGADALPDAVNRAAATLETLSDNRLAWHDARKSTEIVTKRRP